MTKIKDDPREMAGAVRTSSVGWQINQVSKMMSDALSDGLTPLGVTTDQLKIVMTLLEFEGISQSEIGKRIGMPSYAMTRNLDALEESGILKRHPDERSRRSFSIKLTSKGKRLGPKLFQVVKVINASVLSALSEAEAETLYLALNKVIMANLDISTS